MGWLSAICCGYMLKTSAGRFRWRCFLSRDRRVGPARRVLKPPRHDSPSRDFVAGARIVAEPAAGLLAPERRAHLVSGRDSRALRRRWLARAGLIYVGVARGPAGFCWACSGIHGLEEAVTIGVISTASAELRRTPAALARDRFAASRRHEYMPSAPLAPSIQASDTPAAKRF